MTKTTDTPSRLHQCMPWSPSAHAAALLAMALLCAGTAGAATLGEIYAMALQSDATYAAAKAAATAAREKRVQGRASVLPTVNLTGSVKHVQESTTALALYGRDYDTSQIAVTANQPLYRRGNWAAYEQGELQAQLADVQLKLAEQDLLLRTARGYFEVLQAQDALAAIGAQKAAFAQQLAQARRALEIGTAPITDVNEAQARHDLTVAQEIAARNDLEVKQRGLEKIIERALPPLARLADTAPVDVIDPAQLTALVEKASEDALQVGAGELNLRLAREEVTRQEAAGLPTVDVVVSVNETRNGNYRTSGSNTVRQATAGIEVGFGLYQGGAATSRVREAVANVDRAQHELLAARRQARFDARQAYLGVSSGSALHQALRQALASAETQVKSTTRGFEVGVRTRVDVLNAEQQRYATIKDLAAARYQTLVAGLQLRAAAGALGEADLRMLDKLLEGR